MENKYQEGKIYKIVCNISGEVYIGSTKNTLENRLGKHICDTHCMSKQIIERGDYEIILIKNYPCNSRYELEEEEAKYIRNNNCINRCIPHRTSTQYYQDNKNKLLEKQNKYREDNKAKINKQKAEKITCECGCIVRMGGLYNHRKTKKHLKFISNNNI